MYKNSKAPSLIPDGVKQKIPVEEGGGGGHNKKLESLDELLREDEIDQKQQLTTQQAGTNQFGTADQRRLQSKFLHQDENVNRGDEKLGNFNTLLNQQNQVSSDIEKAMATNTLDKKSELWRIERLNNSLQALGTQFGLDVPSQRQYKKAKKIHRLSQQSSWL